MNAEALTVEMRARVHAALADPARLSIVDRLAISDASPGELGRLLGQPTNLVAHHLGVLDAAGLIVRTRSEGDRRRSYLRLESDALSGLLRPVSVAALRVVFVCTHNSARSQLAAALLATRASVPTASAGTEPAHAVHPRAVAIGRRHGLDLRHARPAHVCDIVRADDLVISVCDNAHEHLTGPMSQLHWSVPDPARADSDEAFERALTDIAGRVDRLLPVLNGGSA
jgi:protein-tyrosine-phosphatase